MSETTHGIDISRYQGQPDFAKLKTKVDFVIMQAGFGRYSSQKDAEFDRNYSECRKHGIPYVTIDSPHDSPLHQHAAVNVVSKECTGQYYADIKPEAVMERMMETAEGLTILTQGGGDMLYGRQGEKIHRMKPFSVEVKSTLGAGDTFKAGCVYGLLHGMPDKELVRFASACSAVAISRFPLPLYPPRLEEVQTLFRDAKG